MSLESESTIGGALRAQPLHGKRTLLVVDDAELNRELLELQLQDEFTILKAADGLEALAILQERYSEISLMLLDLVMPKLSGQELLCRIQGDPLLSSVPVVVMTSEDSTEMESHCLELGASDFIRKPFNPFILHHRVRGLIRLHEADSALAAIERDNVTGLYNKEAFTHYAKAFRKEHRGSELVASVAQTVDFEYLEERYGAEALREYLRKAGQLLASSGESNISGYVGEGRFVSLCIACEGMNTAWLRNTMEEFLRESPIPNIKTLFGVYRPVPQERDITQVFRTINTTMRALGDSQREDLVIFGPEEEKALERRRQLVADMETSLANGDFYVVFQPKHRAADGALCGAEALVRWNHPQLGPVSPGEFIPLFEENGFINQLDYYVHTRVYRMMRHWLQEGLPVVPVSANFSRRDLLDSSYVDYLVKIRLEHPDDVPPHLLRAEITEGLLTHDLGLLLENLDKLHSVGYKIELDDFGSGYSNLAALADLPIDTLKLDISLVRTLDTKEPVLCHCIELAHDLELKVVAEGVETKQQLERLSELGCDLIQGYYFSRPLPEAEFVEYLKAHA